MIWISKKLLKQVDYASIVIEFDLKNIKDYLFALVFVKKDFCLGDWDSQAGPKNMPQYSRLSSYYFIFSNIYIL